MSGPVIFLPEYYERIRRLEAGGWWNAAMRDILALALDRARLPRLGLVVDVGCGSGETLAWFTAAHPAWRAVGLDLAWEGLRAVPPIPHGGVVRGSALRLPLPASCADLVVSQDVLQHLPLDGGDVEALGEIRRILKPDGVFVLRTNAQSLPRTPDDVDYDFRRYETRDLRSKLAAAGFAVTAIGRVNALLGLAEIPREWRAHRAIGRGYHGVLADVRGRAPFLDSCKRWWLRAEGRAVLNGWSWRLGRSHIAVCRVAADGTEGRS